MFVQKYSGLCAFARLALRDAYTIDCLARWPHVAQSSGVAGARVPGYEVDSATEDKTKPKLDTLGIEPRAFRMRSGCDTTTPCAR